MKKIFITTILILFVFSSYAQHTGYVITSANDTVSCFIVKKDLFGIKYKANEKDGFIRIKPDNVKEYQLSNDSAIYIAKALRKGVSDIEFVQRLEDGKICLYEQIIKGYYNTSTTNWYANKDNGPVVMIKTSGINIIGPDHSDRKTEFLKLINDDQKITSAYTAENNFSFYTIRKYIQQYNEAASSQKK
ncbi:MAG: hypothetical protein ACHQF4_04115 [Sphingobacteriales bacterium]